MNTSLDKAHQWLVEMGIQTRTMPTCLWVSRDGMCNLGVAGGEQESYDEVLKALQEHTGNKRLFWGGKCDDYLYLESL